MKEDLLHFIWQSKLLLGKTLFTTSGEPIVINQLGSSNPHAGPDFFNARIQIGETLWAGNVEIHVQSSDWNQHRHQTDSAYNNVILHIVYIHDKEITTAGGQTIPTLELRHYIPLSLLQRYNSLHHQQNTHLACEKILLVPPQPQLDNWLQRLLIERLEQKSDAVRQMLVSTHHHYEHCFYLITARYFGMKVNAHPFELLAAQLPLSIIAKHKNSQPDILALVLGISGLLPQLPEYAPLVPRFEHLCNKYNLNCLDSAIWKFGRIRPANFPTIRLIQFATLLFHSSHLLSKILACSSAQELINLYHLPFSSLSHPLRPGPQTINVLLINSVLPFVFVYGKIQHQPELSERVLIWYEELATENNSVVSLFNRFGLPAKNAADSQAYIQLKNAYCNTLNCLHCAIGFHSLIQS